MRIFRDEPNNKNVSIIDRISGEMMNFECGHKLYENGQRIIKEPKAKKTGDTGDAKSGKPIVNSFGQRDIKIYESYPQYEVDGVKIVLTPTVGVIYLPAADITERAQELYTRMTELTLEYEKEFGTPHLSRYAALETGTDHFTVVKCRNNSRATSFMRHVYDDVARSIHLLAPNDKLERIIGKARFTWIITDLNTLIYNIENFRSTRLPLGMQLYSIVYDPYNMLRHPNNTVLFDNITFNDFQVTQHLLAIRSYGALVPGTPLPPESKPEDPAKLRGINDDLRYNIEQMVYPEFVPCFSFSDYTIVLCPKRRGALELMYLLGNNADAPYRKLTGTMPIHSINQEIYQVDYQDVVPLAASDTCNKCQTPLYDDIYGVFPDSRENKCHLYCATCLHSNYYEDGRMSYTFDGQPLYKDTNVIARMKYPRGVDDVIDMIPTVLSNLDMTPIKDILRASFYEPIYHEEPVGTPFAVLIIGYDSQSNVTKNIKYVGYNGSVGSFINYAMHPDNTFQRLVGYENAIKGFSEAKIFNCWIVSTRNSG